MSIVYVSPKSVCRKDLGYKGYESVTFAQLATLVVFHGWNFQIYSPLLLCPADDLSCVPRFSNMNYATAPPGMPRFSDMNPTMSRFYSSKHLSLHFQTLVLDQNSSLSPVKSIILILLLVPYLPVLSILRV